MPKKCLGCGSLLQTMDSNSIGFVKDINDDLCLRCFKIRNYGEYKPVIKDIEEFENLLLNINKSNNLVLLVVDLFQLRDNFDLIKKYLNNDILLVLTKRDLLPNSLNPSKLLKYLDNCGLKFVDKVIISSEKNYQFDLLIDKIREYKNSNYVYVIGFTNAGKSSMINKILYNYSDNDINITTSLLPNTTIDEIEIKIDESLTLIDTPGIVDNGSIYNVVDLKTLKKINPKKTIKPRTYQIKAKQFLTIDNLVRVDFNDVSNITIFMANNLDIKRYYNDNNILTDLEKHELSVKKGEDVVISGLGFIKINKNCNLVLYTLKDVLVFVRKSLI